LPRCRHCQQQKWRDVAGFWATPRRALLLALQVLDSGRNKLSLVLAAIVSAVAVMQVAIDPDKPAFAAFLNYFFCQFPESDHRMPFDVFFSPNLLLVAMRNEAALSLAPKKAASAPRLPVRITRLLLKGF